MLPDGDPQYLSFAEFLQYRFICFTFILGALRSTQFIRFNAGGMRACHLEQQHYVDGIWRPLVTALYSRAKVRNGPNPTAPDEVSELTIVCTCPGIHQPLGIDWKVDGTVKYLFGCTTCWFNLFTFIRLGQDLDCPDRFLRSWNKRAKGPGTVFWSADRITGAIQRWCSYSGLDLPAANNTWARKTYRTTITVLLCTMGLVEMQLPSAAVMAITGHKSEKQMRADYHKAIIKGIRQWLRELGNC